MTARLHQARYHQICCQQQHSSFVSVVRNRTDPRWGVVILFSNSNARRHDRQQLFPMHQQPSMPQTVFNPRTGLARRQPPRFTPRKRRDPSLYAGKRHFQKLLTTKINESMSLIGTLSGLLLACFLRNHQLHTRFGPNQGSYVNQACKGIGSQ